MGQMLRCTARQLVSNHLATDSVRRQHPWDQIGYFGYGGIPAHPNSTEREDQ